MFSGVPLKCQARTFCGPPSFLGKRYEATVFLLGRFAASEIQVINRCGVVRYSGLVEIEQPAFFFAGQVITFWA